MLDVFVAQCHFFLSLSLPLLVLLSTICYVHVMAVLEKGRERRIRFLCMCVCAWCDVMCWQTRRLLVSLSLSFFRLFAFVDEE